MKNACGFRENLRKQAEKRKKRRSQRQLRGTVHVLITATLKRVKTESIRKGRMRKKKKQGKGRGEIAEG